MRDGAGMSTDADTQQPFSPFVAQILTAQHQMYRDTSSRLIDALEAQLAEAHAHADAVTDGIERLLDSDFMPTPAAVRRALYPTDEVVALYRKDGDAS